MVDPAAPPTMTSATSDDDVLDPAVDPLSMMLLIARCSSDDDVLDPAADPLSMMWLILLLILADEDPSLVLSCRCG